ncbi:phosphate ABC transporter substrate-binding protein [Verrucomicrobium sp. BvORR034]|uniref:phosphate ABC transporter substrate-binding protein n=1 Tax=Verrucomicrobium sp. BvORR034 TaxID=1396418 RepID=UPI0006791540|nr:phosphate ABC transporter substrate-binding protein [Verrucomicrobium sp. BvORR034]
MKSTIITSLLALAFTAGLNAQSVLRVRGSDTLGAKLVPQWAEQFKKQGGGVSFDIAAEGSSTAFTNLAAGTAEIGMSSRKVKDDERTFAKTKGVFLTEHEVAWDMIAVVVNKNNPVANLTKKQIAGIFTGAIKDWSEVGGTPGPISVYTRNTSSGTYKDWQTLAMKGKDYASSSQKMAGNEQIVAETAGNAGGIGYVGLAYAHGKGIKAISVDGTAPTPENVKGYAYSRPTFFYTNGAPQGKVKEFIDFVHSDAGKKVSQLVGFIPAK